MLTAALTASAGLAIGAGVQHQVSFHDPNTHTLGGGQSVTIWSGFVGGGHLAEFQYSFDYGEPVSDASWASDMQITLTTPAGAFTIAGYNSIPDFVPPYDGPESAEPGTYGWTVDLLSLDLGFVNQGTYAVTIANDWFADPNPNTVSNFSGSLFATLRPPIPPAPSAVGLFGIAGLAAARRRR